MSRWASLVYHVLAHVPAGVRGRTAASAHDEVWIEYSARRLGPASERPLARDAEVLARTLADHEPLAAAQLLAWLFETPERAAACSRSALADLAPEDVDAPSLLPSLRRLGDPVEHLFCAALLERAAFDRLPALEADSGARAALQRLAEHVPALRRCRVSCVPALRLRGRIFRRSILVGVPSAELGVLASHVSWQAAHEATVGELTEELSRSGVTMEFAALEREALRRLGKRASDLGWEQEHGAWLDRLDLSALEP